MNKLIYLRIPEESADFNQRVYELPQYRMAPYIVGMLAGYVFFVTKGKLKVHWVSLTRSLCILHYDVV